MALWQGYLFGEFEFAAYSSISLIKYIFLIGAPSLSLAFG